jgi:hypothetical protein
MQDRTEGRDPALLALADQASALVEELEARGCEVTFQHMRREFNTEADALANEAMDTATSSLRHTADFALTRATLPLPKPDAQDADELEAEDAGAKAKDSGREPGPTRPSRHIPRLTAPPSREQLLMWLGAIHQDSRALGKLSPVRQWSTETLVAWTSACKAFTPALAAALDGNDDTALVQALLDLIELPTRVLRQHCPDQQIQVKPRGRREADEAAAA